MPNQDYTKWHLPKGAKARLGKGRINDIACSPDSTCLAVASSIGTWLYDVDTGEELALLTGHTATVSGVAYSPDGNTIATGSYDGTVRLWDATTQKHKTTFRLGTVISVMYSPDGKTIVTTTSEGFVHLWNVITSEHKTRLGILDKYGDSNLTSVVYMIDGSVLVTQNTDGIMDFWDTVTGKHKGKFTETRRYKYIDDEFGRRREKISEISTTACSPDGQTIALGYADGTVKLWNPEAHKHTTTGDSEVSLPKAILSAHTSGISSLAFDTKGEILASGSSDGMICLWNAFTGEPIAPLIEHATTVLESTYSYERPPPRSISELTFSPNSITLVSQNYGGVVCLWDIISRIYKTIPFVIAEDKVIPTKHTDVSSVEYSPDGTLIAIWGFDGVSLCDYVWDDVTHFTGHIFSISSIAYSPDGETIATGSDGGVHLWDVATGQLRTTPIGQTCGVSNVVYSPDGKTIATTRKYSTTAHLWDAATGEHKTTLEKHTNGFNDTVYGIVYSPDGKTIATTSEFGTTAHLWDAATGEHKTTLENIYYVSNIVYSPDGKIIATGCKDGTMCLWNAATGESSGIFAEHTSGILSLSFSPDGKTIATGGDDGTVLLWNTATGESSGIFAEHTSGILSLSFSPDGKTIVTHSAKEVYLWDIVTGKQIATFTGHVGDIYSFSFSPDGKTIATGGDDGTVLLWETTSFICQYPNVNPQKIHGNWRAGWILDVHTLSSYPLPGGGYDTKRTEIGELVYQLKYQNDRTKVQPIAEVAANFIREKFAVDGYPILPYLKAILPIPPSDQNRNFQPVTEVAQEIGRLLSVPVRTDYLKKVRQTIPHKNIPDDASKHEQIRGAFVVESQDLRSQCVLLVDDIYKSGSTLKEASKVLYEQGGVKHVLVLTLTRTRKGSN